LSQTPQVESPIHEICVAVDLETTGLDSERDEIIEIGAVKFQGEKVLDTFQTLVNPGRPLPPFVRSLTGITQQDLDGAPNFSIVAPDLMAFLGSHPIVGQNISFDLAFLRQKLVAQSNPAYDTRDLASALMPYFPEYSLGRLVEELGLGHARPHRAWDDADVTRQVYLALVEHALDVPAHQISEIARWAMRSRWSMAPLFKRIENAAISDSPPATMDQALDLEALRRRLPRSRPLSANLDIVPIDLSLLKRIFAADGPLSRRFPGYEARQEQQRMALEVATAINDAEHLVVEAGTGVGKSVAYLLPAMLFAVANNKRVVVSTATINLQDQLIRKDIPALIEALSTEPEFSDAEIKVAQLKGRANYLCLRRWLNLRDSETLSQEEARLLSKTMLWMEDTTTGDRAEIGTAGRELRAWPHFSADGGDCVAPEGVCFFRHAKDEAESAHILVVNHSLLLTDLARGGGAIPPYDYLIIDEAHHLEEEATKRFGFDIIHRETESLVDGLVSAGGMVEKTRFAVRLSSMADRRRRDFEELLTRLAEDTLHWRQMWHQFRKVIFSVMLQYRDAAEDSSQIQITSSTRAQPAWSDVEIAWENADLSLKEVLDGLTEALESIEDASDVQIPNQDAVALEASALLQQGTDLRDHTLEFVIHPRKEMIYWLTAGVVEGTAEMHAAPLSVAPALQDGLFAQTKSVVMTSATLSADGTFDYFRRRVGIELSSELLVGSPFNYRKAVLLAMPPDIPEPTTGGYQSAVADAVIELALAAEGRTMVLFTSYNALRATHAAVLGPLSAAGIRLLGQGIEAPPRQLLRSFQDDPKAVLLGTNTFWEGVDLRGGQLKVLVLARLPFNPPSDPVFAARSELFEDPFKEFAVPQAILRFRQGFGRLIRSQEDRGVVVVLDRRLSSRAYGKTFIGAIPPCTTTDAPITALRGQVHEWLQRP
jgi:predicted DnaQ family exonuclease/DinG family helicase